MGRFVLIVAVLLLVPSCFHELADPEHGSGSCGGGLVPPLLGGERVGQVQEPTLDEGHFSAVVGHEDECPRKFLDGCP